MLKFTEDHEWLKLDGDVLTVGITEHASAQLGDVVFVELPEEGDDVEAGDDIVTIESVKAASDIAAPVTGEIVEINRLQRPGGLIRHGIRVHRLRPL